MFRVPSSTPPSTPGSHRGSRNIPSTTPAGPPPDDSHVSSTPAEPPPPQPLFGSQFNFTKPPDFNRSGFNSSPPKHELTGFGSGLFGAPTSARPGSQRSRSGNSWRVPSSPPHNEASEEESAGEDEEMGEEEEEDENDVMDEDEEEESEEEEQHGFARSRSRTNNPLSHSILSRTSINQMGGPTIVRPDAKQSRYDLLSIAKGLVPTQGQRSMAEPDDLILEMEEHLGKLHESVTSDSPERRTIVTSEVAQELVKLWEEFGEAAVMKRTNPLTSLLLSLHYPKPLSDAQAPVARALIASRPDPRHFTPIPKALLDWLDEYSPSQTEVGEVLQVRGGYSAHEYFWDAVWASAIRGKFLDTLKLLRGANLSVAQTASIDGLGEEGYRGHHLDNADRATGAAINLLEQCPAITSNDWDVKGPDWIIFRQHVQNALYDLEEFAEGASQNRHSQLPQGSHFGLSQSINGFNLSVASRRAESRVPWSIYENLSRLYKQLLGSEEDLVASSGDWIEAVVVLAIWWNGDEEDFGQGSLAASRRSIARSQRVRTVDVTPVKAYCQRLSASLATVLESDEEELDIDPTDPYDVGLSCIFDDNIEGVLQILRGWSAPVAAAVAEVASAGDWFRRADGILDQFDESDLMVLSYNDGPRTSVSKDDLLMAYADQLARRDGFTSEENPVSREGWELAIQVLGRLDDSTVGNARIEAILNSLPLESSDRVDKITELCYRMGLSAQAQTIAEKYADHLRHNTQNYGDTLLYYARAHDAKKIQKVLQVLVAHCIVKSKAYPPLSELDERLRELITSPKQTLTRLAAVDSESAQLLSNYLSGYATIRKFYDLRDEDISPSSDSKSKLRPMARKRVAANSLTVIISSAASCIRGGLYDEEVETVVQVDVLLALLGEALMFVNQPKRTLTLRHLHTLLAAVEDIDTAPSMVRNQCEVALATTLGAAYEGHVPSPKSLLQKSTSNLTTASSQFSLIGSTEFGSVEGQSTESSAVLVRGGNVDDAKRAWDWRKGFNKDATGKDIIRVLRLALAKETARAFAEGEV